MWMRITHITKQDLKTERFRKVNFKILGLPKISDKFEHQSLEDFNNMNREIKQYFWKSTTFSVYNFEILRRL